MKFQILEPELPSYRKFFELRTFGARKTILRQMEDALISKLELRGEVLDFGGGTKATYLPYLRGDLSIRSVNIDAEFAPTHIVAPGDPLPFANEEFDTVITFNTLEHVYDDVGALQELARVMKPGGELHVIVPFMYPVHGHPDDYNRHTPSWWGETLGRIGLSQAELTPLIFGRSAGARLVRGRGERLVRGMNDFLAATRDIALARLLFAGKTTYSGRRGQRVWASAPGWYIRAVK